MSLVELARFQTRVEADLARLLLEAEGFDAILFDTGMNYVLGPFTPVRLMVLEEDFDAAARVLADEGLL